MANDDELVVTTEETPGAVEFTDWEKQVIEEESIESLAIMYRQAYDDVEEYTRQLRKLTSKKEALGEQFCKVLLSNGLNSVKTDEGSFAPKVDHCVSIVSDEAAFKVIEEAGHGNVIKRKVEWQTLNKIYRDDPAFRSTVLQDDENKDVFKTWDKHGIRIRRSND